MTDQNQKDLVTVTIDGVDVQAPRNAMLIEVADQAGVSIPRFCYHKHLSVAANCRMCMVEVEKAPKPLPACATPVSDGMKVFTRSELALDAQKGTMEFLLINHPLDCPVCDQGGECELQDVAMGYGSDVSRFNERKRVVRDKNIGPLVSTDMTRCIHCTRCVRFGNEIAGVSELGATGRGEFMEIGTYVEKSLSSELSGNVIDLCPVGALNAKPSRMKARAWEMVEQSNISAHDSFGSNLIMHTLRNEVIRVVPQENPDVNETWISDRDRFSYEGMYSDNRLKHVMYKDAEEWKQLHWSDALSSIAAILKKYDADDVGFLISPNQSNEELYLTQKIARALGVNNIDHRVNQIDFQHQDSDPAFPWLGQNIANLEKQDAILIIGSDLRNEQPMLAHKVRKASARGAKVFVVNPHHCEFHMSLSGNIIVKPQEWLARLIGLLAGLNNSAKHKAPSEWQSLLSSAKFDDDMAGIAKALLDKENSTVLIGSLMQHHYEYSNLRAVSFCLAQLTESTFGYISTASNASGASLLGVLPHRAIMSQAIDEPGMTYQQMIQSPRKVLVLIGLEPEWDCVLPVETLRALEQAEQVIAINSFTTEAMQQYCDWMLPIKCYAEAEGTKINMEGRWQSYSKVVEADEDVKDGWKILRMLGSELELEEFDYLSIEDVRKEISQQLDSSFEFSNVLPSFPDVDIKHWESDVIFSTGATPIYSIDAIVRNASSLKQAQNLDESVMMVNVIDVEKHGLIEGKWVKVSQGDYSGIFKCVINNDILPGTVHIPRGLPRSEKLSGFFVAVELKNLSVA
ncbi:MAG: NADH-quinone oxidoreductase subunit NuoG [Gammaproteobacteria bacterium]|nr:NADH-quinone oxidoreductase subunit NuoG [Gammaproteobacteria bacterium]